MNAYLDAMQRYGSSSGRSTRSQFWFYILVYVVIFIVAVTIDVLMGADLDHDMLVATSIVSLVHLIPSITLSVRRLHDIDRSGWWVLLSFIPVIGIIPLLVFACSASTPGSNRFGAPVTGKGESSTPATPPVGAQLRPSSMADIEKLEKFAALKASGMIDDAEFQKMKSGILSGPHI